MGHITDQAGVKFQKRDEIQKRAGCRHHGFVNVTIVARLETQDSSLRIGNMGTHNLHSKVNASL